MSDDAQPAFQEALGDSSDSLGIDGLDFEPAVSKWIQGPAAEIDNDRRHSRYFCNSIGSDPPSDGVAADAQDHSDSVLLIPGA
jgi:hypothetical protein